MPCSLDKLKPFDPAHIRANLRSIFLSFADDQTHILQRAAAIWSEKYQDIIVVFHFQEMGKPDITLQKKFFFAGTKDQVPEPLIIYSNF